jgi:hypothetical protein
MPERAVRYCWVAAPGTIRELVAIHRRDTLVQAASSLAQELTCWQGISKVPAFRIAFEN